MKTARSAEGACGGSDPVAVGGGWCSFRDDEKKVAN